MRNDEYTRSHSFEINRLTIQPFPVTHMRRKIFHTILLALIILLTACSSLDGVLPSPSSDPTITMEPSQSSAIELPTATQEQSLPVIMITAEEGQINADFLDRLSLLLADQGFNIAFKSSLNIDGLPNDLHYLLAAESNVSVDDQISSPMLSFSFSLDQDQNIPVLRYSEMYYQRAAFLAGYSAAIATPNFRIGYIDLLDFELSGSFDSFENGVTYYCGHCSPQYPPFLDYPVYFQLSTPFTSEKINSIITALEQNYVTTVYVHPYIYNNELLQSLEDSGIDVIGNRLLGRINSPVVDFEVGPDPSATADELVPYIIAGTEPDPVSPPLAVHNNSGWFSEGRMQHLEQIITMLNEGTILPIE